MPQSIPSILSFIISSATSVFNTVTNELSAVGFNPSQLYISSATSSIGTNSGALIVAGGVGIGKNLYVGGVITATNVYVNGYAVSTSTAGTLSAQYFGTSLGTVTTLNFATGTTATLVGGVLTIQATNTGSTFNTSTLVAQAVNATSATNAATAYSTVAVHTAGTGLSGSTFNGSTAVTWTLNTATLMTQAVSATSLVSGTWTFTVSSTGSVTLNGMPFVSGSVGASGTGTTTTFVISNTTQSTGTNSGALQVAGGAGIGGGLTVGGASVVSVTDNTNAALRITQLGTGNALVVEDEANPDASPFVIANNGTVIVGYTSRITQANLIEVHGSATINSTPAVGVYSWGTLATGGGLNLYKSRSGTVGTYSTATNGSQSSVRFQFDDGAAFQQAASIIGSVEGTPALNSVPGRLTFSTTPDASVTPLERMRIDSTGQTKFSTAITSTSTTTGALVVTGGVGIGGNLYAGGTVSLSTLTFYSSDPVVINQGSTPVFKTDGSNISIGSFAGSNAGFAVAIGLFAGTTNQGLGGIALGEYAGSSNQGQYAIAIGTGAGQNDQPAGSIVLDATWNGGASFQAKNTGTYIAPIRADATTSATNYLLNYNPTSREITTSNRIASLLITGNATSTGTNSGALQVVGGVGIGGNLTVGGTVTGGGVRTTTTSTAPSNPTVGDIWYYTTGDVIYRYTNDGSTTTNFWLDITGPVYTLNTSGSLIIGTASAGTTATTSAAVGYLGMPQNSTASSYTLVANDQGKHIYISASGQTITIPANATVPFPIGSTVALIAGPSATTVTISITTDTMYLGGTGSTGNRTLAAYGMATAVKVATTTWFISGLGLT